MLSSLVAVVTSRKDSFSLPRRKEDYTFDRSTLQSVRASGCAGTSLPPVFFLLTSTPNRADRLPVLLGTMRAQSHPPSGVVLTIPRAFARFNESYRLPEAEQWSELRVRRIARPTPILTRSLARALPLPLNTSTRCTASRSTQDRSASTWAL